MKHMLFLAVMSFAMASCVSAPAQAPQPGSSNGFAVIELFTSEGCSSCPPADRLMARLSAEYAGRPVLFLGEHVDYWDRLGWKDSFSEHLFTERQKEYAARRHTETVYTPQLVVNGYLVATGSEEGKIRKVIEKGLADQAGSPLRIAAKADGTGVQVSYTTGERSRNTRVVLMLVQRRASSQVEKGENSGRHLEHVNVVRSISYANSGKGQERLEIPQGLQTKDFFAAALLQDIHSGRILGMAKAEI